MSIGDIRGNWMKGIRMYASELEESESKSIRQSMLGRYVNTGSDSRYLNHESEYLWDNLKDDYCSLKRHVNFEYIENNIHIYGRVYLQWDFIPILPIGRERVFEVDYSILIDNLDKFPKDLYIFDNTFEWLLIQTHESFYSVDDRWIIVDPSNRIVKVP